MPEDIARILGYRSHQMAGLVLGPLLFAILMLLPPPEGLAPAGWTTAAVAVWIAVWWATEALPLAATALLLLVLPGTITDTGLAIAGAVLLFVIPADWRQRTFLLDWETARRVPWEILILFGGGLSLAQAIDGTGLARWIGGSLQPLTGGPPILLLGGVTLLVILLTELTSNTATAAALLPVAGALAAAAGMEPLLLAVAVALAASAAFMLPVATPPNAIVFASGHVTLSQMIRAGLWLNVIGVCVITSALALIAGR